ncbi:MAG: hypothetical protein ACJ8F7_08315 [Gemmataceae bacterium]
MNPWQFLLIGYPVTIAVETPILLVGLSPRHSWKRRLFAGVWLTACTYPIVVLTMPELLYHDAGHRAPYLLVAETFAPVAECTLFWLAFGERKEFGRRSMWWDFAAITTANLASFGIGEVIIALDGWTKLTAWLF